MIGIWRSAGLALIKRVASYPSMPGSCMSMRIRSGRSDSAMATPASPVTASITSKPAALSVSFMIRRLSS